MNIRSWMFVIAACLIGPGASLWCQVPGDENLKESCWVMCGEAVANYLAPQRSLRSECNLSLVPMKCDCSLTMERTDILFALYDCCEKLEAKYFLLIGPPQPSQWEKDGFYILHGEMCQEQEQIILILWKAYGNTKDEAVRQAFLKKWQEFVHERLDMPWRMSILFRGGGHRRMSDVQKNNLQYFPKEVWERARTDKNIFANLVYAIVTGPINQSQVVALKELRNDIAKRDPAWAKVADVYLGRIERGRSKGSDLATEMRDEDYQVTQPFFDPVFKEANERNKSDMRAVADRMNTQGVRKP